MSSSVVGGPTFHEDPEEEGRESVKFFDPPKVVKNRRAAAKKAGKALLAVSEKTVGLAQQVTHVGTIGSTAALVTGAAVSATGVGLLAAAGAGMIVSSTLAARSAYKTHHHLKGLQDIYNDRKNLGGEQSCKEVSSDGTEAETKYSLASHEVIANEVLPYIIRQKVKKRRLKIASANPISSPFATLYAVSNKWGKAYRGELGKSRNAAAQWLGAHFLECNCKLASRIIAELHGEEKMNAFASSEFKDVWPELATKMKST
jgi:hypothetical protein